MSFKGKHHSEEYKRKMSEIMKGKPNPRKGKPNPHRGHSVSKDTKLKISKARKGKTFSEETKKRLSESHKGKGEAQRGSKNPSWKGGINPLNNTIRKSLEFRLWREAIFARDNWTCQKCGQKGGKLHPHHIFNFATYINRRFDILNGITLCENCHKDFHKKYGNRNNTQEQLDLFLEEMK